MKVAFICTEKLPVPPISGGAIQIYIEGILPDLSKHHDITVFGVRHESLPYEEEVNGVKYIRVEGGNKAEYVKNIEQRLDNSYDLIHVFNRPRTLVNLSKRFPDNKFSLSLHNDMLVKEKIPFDLGLKCVAKAEFITTVSKYVAENVKKRFPTADKKLYPVYSGVDINKYKPALSNEGIQNKVTFKKLLKIENKKVVLYVGRLGEKKGADKLILAMKRVMEERSDVALVIIGSKWYGKNTADEYTESVKELSNNLKGSVVFTGYLSQEKIAPYFNIGDIFVCPSQWNEPLARVHYEAMAAGLPIITTNRGGNKEVIEGYGNGIMIDDFSNPNAFSDRILELLDNPAKAIKMGEKGRILAEEKYNWHRVANNLLPIFNAVEQSTASKEVSTEVTPQPEPVMEKKPHKPVSKEPAIPSAEKVILKPVSKEPAIPSAEKVVLEPVSKEPAIPSAEKVVLEPEAQKTTKPLVEEKGCTVMIENYTFFKMISEDYPGIPLDVAEYLENFKDYFMRGKS